MSLSEHFLSFVGIVDEAVEYGAELPLEGQDEFLDILPAWVVLGVAIALVDDDVEIQLGRKLELLLENLALAGAVALFRVAVWCRVVVIEADLTDGGDARVGGEGAELA